MHDSLLPRSVEKGPTRLRWEIEIATASKCDRQYLKSLKTTHIYICTHICVCVYIYTSIYVYKVCVYIYTSIYIYESNSICRNRKRKKYLKSKLICHNTRRIRYSKVNQYVTYLSCVVKNTSKVN